MNNWVLPFNRKTHCASKVAKQRITKTGNIWCLVMLYIHKRVHLLPIIFNYQIRNSKNFRSWRRVRSYSNIPCLFRCTPSRLRRGCFIPRWCHTHHRSSKNIELSNNILKSKTLLLNTSNDTWWLLGPSVPGRTGRILLPLDIHSTYVGLAQSHTVRHAPGEELPRQNTGHLYLNL